MTRGRAQLRAALFAAIVTIGLARPGSAATPVRIALLATTPDDPLAGRIEAELRTLGFQVERSAISPDIPIDELVHQQLAGGAGAAVVADGHRTDVWIAGAGPDRIGLRQELEVEDAAGLQSVLALRTVEFLRISLGLATPPPVTPPPVTPVTPVTPVARTAPDATAARPIEAPTSVALDVSSGFLASVGRVGTLVVVGASLRVRLGPLLGFELCGYAPLNSFPTAADGQQARTAVWLAGGGLLVAPRQAGRRLTGEIGAGAMAALVHSVGAPVAPAEGGTVDRVGAVIYGRAAGKLRLARDWALRLDILTGAAVARPVIQFDQYDEASWGRPFVAALGGGEVSF